MTADTTYRSNDPMDCERVGREEIAERYLLRRLSDEDRDAFEAHYFECGRCFDDVRSLEALGEELGATGERAPGGPRLAARWAPRVAVAAAVVLIASTLVWLRSPSTSDPPQTPASQSTPQPRVAETPETAPEAPPVANLSIEQLARFEPPRFEPPTLRGAADEATARFLRGMDRYRQADYAGAIVDLREASQLDPEAPHALFFLGVSYLAAGQDIAAIDRLKAMIALGDSAYLEEGHWYLAKAYLRRRDLSAARTELRELATLRGSDGGEAGQLLAQIETLERRD